MTTTNDHDAFDDDAYMRALKQRHARMTWAQRLTERPTRDDITHVQHLWPQDWQEKTAFYNGQVATLVEENERLRAILAHAYFDIIKHGAQGACFCGVCLLAREAMTQEEADRLLYPPTTPPEIPDDDDDDDDLDDDDEQVEHTSAVIPYHDGAPGEWRATVRCQQCGANIHAHGSTTPRGDPIPDPPTITCAACGASFLLIIGPQ